MRPTFVALFLALALAPAPAPVAERRVCEASAVWTPDDPNVPMLIGGGWSTDPSPSWSSSERIDWSQPPASFDFAATPTVWPAWHIAKGEHR